MSDEHQTRPHRHEIPRRRQIAFMGALVAAAASAAGLFFLGGAFLGHGEASARTSGPPLSRFIPPKQQLAALEIEPVRLAIFYRADGEARAMPAIPARAVFRDRDGEEVWVAGNDGSLSLREVTLGKASGNEVEVTRGLSAGDKIVTSGAPFDRAAPVE